MTALTLIRGGKHPETVARENHLASLALAESDRLIAQSDRTIARVSRSHLHLVFNDLGDGGRKRSILAAAE